MLLYRTSWLFEITAFVMAMDCEKTEAKALRWLINSLLDFYVMKERVMNVLQVVISRVYVAGSRPSGRRIVNLRVWEFSTEMVMFRG